MKEFEEENNEMWDEIQMMNESIPDKNIIPESINVLERKEIVQFKHAFKPTKERSPPKQIEKMRRY